MVNVEKSIAQEAQEYFESIDASDEERSDEEIEADNQKAQNWVDEIQSMQDTLPAT